jgi:uncharacterized membrane protein
MIPSALGLPFKAMTASISSSYVAIPLNPLASAYPEVTARALNNYAVAVGEAARGTGDFTACQWLAASAFDLGNFGHGPSTASAINNHDQICGSAHSASGIQQAALWQSGRIRNLGSFAGSGFASNALAMTDTPDPLVYGFCQAAGSANRAVCWQNLQIQALQHDADWTFSVAKAVTYNNYPAGAVFSSLQNRQYTVFWAPSPQELPGLMPNSTSEPTSGSAAGYLVGISDRGPGTESEAVLFLVTQPGAPSQSLQNLPVAVRSYAFGVNTHGVTVGAYEDSSSVRRAFACATQSGLQMVDLTALLQPGGPVTTVLSAKAINDSGVILADCLANGSPCQALLWPV